MGPAHVKAACKHVDEIDPRVFEVEEAAAAVVPLLCQKTNTIGKIMGPLGLKNAALDIPMREHPALYLMKRKLE